MIFTAHITILPHDALLDPQGKAVQAGLHTLGLKHIEGVRVGRHIRLAVEAESAQAAEATVQQACEKLLVNAIMEQFTFRVEQAETSPCLSHLPFSW